MRSRTRAAPSITSSGTTPRAERATCGAAYDRLAHTAPDSPGRDRLDRSAERARRVATHATAPVLCGLSWPAATPCATRRSTLAPAVNVTSVTVSRRRGLELGGRSPACPRVAVLVELGLLAPVQPGEVVPPPPAPAVDGHRRAAASRMRDSKELERRRRPDRADAPRRPSSCCTSDVFPRGSGASPSHQRAPCCPRVAARTRGSPSARALLASRARISSTRPVAPRPTSPSRRGAGHACAVKSGTRSARGHPRRADRPACRRTS